MQITWEYVAGFTDGEGHLGIVGTAPRITLAQRTPEVLIAIQAFLTEQEIFSIVYQRKRVEGSKSKTGIWVLVVNRRLDVYRICMELESRTIVKQQQIGVLFAWYLSHQPRKWWTEIDKDYLIAAFAEGCSYAEIARRLDCARGLIELAAKNYGLSSQDGRYVDGIHVVAVLRSIREKSAACKDCGKPIYPQGLRCHSCATKLRHLEKPESFKASSLTSATGAINQLAEQEKH